MKSNHSLSWKRLPFIIKTYNLYVDEAGIFPDDVIKWKQFSRYWPFCEGNPPFTGEEKPVIWDAIALIVSSLLFPGKWDHYHSCWCMDSLNCQVINIHGIVNVRESTISCHERGFYLHHLISILAMALRMHYRESTHLWAPYGLLYHSLWCACQ